MPLNVFNTVLILGLKVGNPLNGLPFDLAHPGPRVNADTGLCHADRSCPLNHQCGECVTFEGFLSSRPASAHIMLL